MARSAEPCKVSASVVVHSAIQSCWNLYIDNAQVSQWAPHVQKIDCDTTTLDKGVTRKSHVVVDGQSGHTVEQCSQFTPLKCIEMNITEETFGFSHMLNHYGFSVSFDVDNEDTLLVMNTCFTPKKIFASMMSSSATHQQISNLMLDNLNGFKRYAEAR